MEQNPERTRCRPPQRAVVEGQAIVVLALVLVLLIAAAGFAIDGSAGLYYRRAVNNAADAASVAATRELIRQKRIGGDGAAIHTAIRDSLNRHELPGAAMTWQAFYIQRMAVDTNMAVVEDDPDADVLDDADGVRVIVAYNFQTYFMSVFGINTLTVGASGASMYGPLGTAVGPDLVPLALSETGYYKLKDRADAGDDVRLDMENEIVTGLQNDALLGLYFGPIPPDDVVTRTDIKHVSFGTSSATPLTGNAADCTPIDGVVLENLVSWWCNGSPNKLRVGRQLPFTASPNWGRLTGPINNRVGDTVIMLIYAETDEDGDGNAEYTVNNFVAVEIIDYDAGDRVLTVELVEDYATSGAMIGDGSGVDYGVHAINLVR